MLSLAPKDNYTIAKYVTNTISIVLYEKHGIHINNERDMIFSGKRKTCFGQWGQVMPNNTTLLSDVPTGYKIYLLECGCYLTDLSISYCTVDIDTFV
jgi:hypothetical protein